MAVTHDFGVGNSILRNSIFSNGGLFSTDNLGTDLLGGTEDAEGRTPNDAGDGDIGPNNLQNKPESCGSAPC